MEKITDKISALPDGASFFSLEFFPPKTPAGFSNLSARLERMSRALRPLFINVTWGAGGSTSTKSLELADLCQRQLGLTTCLHLTCTNMSRRLIDKALMNAKNLGIRNILALRGDLPREDEYGIDGDDGNSHDTASDQSNDNDNAVDNESKWKFVWAIDLVRYIRKKYGDFFCIGVASYPEGHTDESYPTRQSPEFDLPFLVDKVKAGADFILTQFFFDVEQYDKFETLLRNEPSGTLKTIPIIPGLMPIQGYKIIRRTTKLSHVKIPDSIMKKIDSHKGDDEEIKKIGIEVIADIVQQLKVKPGKRGFHFYTLNLEKAVSQIIERGKLIRLESPSPEPEALTQGQHLIIEPTNKFDERRRASSANSGPRNRVIVEQASSPHNKDYEALAIDAAVPETVTRKNTLAISEGEGSLGREATWDDFPNGRWGDARSPAFGEIDGYGVSLHVSISEAIRLWGYPGTIEDISDIFVQHVQGTLPAIPWSEEDVNPETSTIKDQLVKLNRKGWWTVASQPAVNCVPSGHKVFGWGPKNGFVFQKPFVEFFIPESEWDVLRQRLDSQPAVTYMAANLIPSHFQSSEGGQANPVTWGTFSGKEIITPTIIEPVSFRAWREEAFSIWREWERIYPVNSASAKLLNRIRNEYWLVNIVHHEFMESEALWDLLFE